MFDRESDLSVTPERLLAWRIDRLRDAGFSDRAASALAGDARYDVHALLELIDRGGLGRVGSPDRGAALECSLED